MITFRYFAAACALLILTGPALAKSSGTTVCLAMSPKTCAKWTQCPYQIPQPNGSLKLAFKNCDPCVQYTSHCTKYGPGAPGPQ